MSKNARNVAILALVALAIVAVPAGFRLAALALALISLAFLAAIAWFGYRLYMENRLTLWGLTTYQRSLLYGALAVGFLTLVATPRLWASGPGVAVWIALLAGAGLALYHVWRESHRYGI